MTKKVSKSLKNWFLVHFLVDLIIAIPLIFFPSIILSLFGIVYSEQVTARLVGAALLWIGGTSFFVYNKTKESFDTLLTLKIIWSISAIVALTMSLFNGAPLRILLVLIIFAFFSLIWIYYKLKK